MKKNGTLYWITGLSGAGKTTIGRSLYYEIKKKKDNIVLLDGDVLKAIVDDNLGYSEEDRHKRAMKYATLCKTLTDQGIIVICCTIAMFEDIREWNRANNSSYVEVFINTPMEVLIQRDQKGMYSKYKKGKSANIVGMDIAIDYPKHPDLEIVNDGKTPIKTFVNQILNYHSNLLDDYCRDTKYWNRFYSKNDGVKLEPSLFAKYVGTVVSHDKHILELGCGNGRDSMYFYKLGMHVTAVDAADKAIRKLQEHQDDRLNFICDDFVSTSFLFSTQYDYIYSRFTLHAISDRQEEELLKNVYKALKYNGKFFIEARSVNDTIYGKGEMVGRNAYLYNNHFRRFLVLDELVKRLEEKGFCIENAE